MTGKISDLPLNIAYPLFWNFVQPLFSVTSNPHPHCSFFGWMGDHATLEVLFYLILWIYTCRAMVLDVYDLDVCFIQQGVKFTEVWHMWFFASALTWYHTQEHTHTHKDTQHTQGPVNLHAHINIYIHHLLCAHSNYLY